jgi:hypothetical protein
VDETRRQGLERLIALEGRLRDLGASVTRDPLDGPRDSHVVRVAPQGSDRLPFSWTWKDKVVLQAGRHGGRWELPASPEGSYVVEELVDAIVTGRVSETFAPLRSSVLVTLSNGSQLRATGYSGCLAVLVPLPRWRRWGRRVDYLPY